MNCCVVMSLTLYYLEYFAELHDDDLDRLTEAATEMGSRRPILRHNNFLSISEEVIHIHILTKNNCWTTAILLLSSVDDIQSCCML